MSVAPVKYKLCQDQPLQIEGVTLYRVVRVKDGRVGGWIESERNLSQDGKCFVYEEAKVYGEAQVSGDSRVFGRAVVRDQAQVMGEARVSGNSELEVQARVFDSARVYGCARVAGAASVGDCVVLKGSVVVGGRAKLRGSVTYSGGVEDGYVPVPPSPSSDQRFREPPNPKPMPTMPVIETDNGRAIRYGMMVTAAILLVTSIGVAARSSLGL